MAVRGRLRGPGGRATVIWLSEISADKVEGHHGWGMKGVVLVDEGATGSGVVSSLILIPGV
ncbi:UNVERIFIED_CONTAM: hypothetical protein Sangu_1005400 [Sesamum angustifolium]|uniref:Uncharacterized protein n=1 Tax=Sesamum angustifolium TaxID=2727405 RepID=A0AAW2PFG7_9LAMI